MSLEDIRAEYAQATIGPMIYAQIVQLARSVVRRYDPRTYGPVHDWSDGLDDLVQEVVERLLREGQLSYAVTVAVDEHHWRSLIERQIKRTLARRRRRTVVDNLLDRADAILLKEPFTSVSQAGITVFQLRAGATERRRPSDGELRQAAIAVASVPVIRGDGQERAPIVYTSRALETVLFGIAQALPGGFAKNDLDRIFRMVLTPWLASDLGDIEEAADAPSADLTPGETIEVDDIAERSIASLDGPGRLLLRLKYAGLSDQEVGLRLEISRPTVAKRKEAVLEVIRAALDGTSERIREAVVQEIGARLPQASGPHP